ncbi:hypothetical protein [Hyphobacterium sp.]|uniref:hypothetical protein n=1 Tax=Hyphobacterium sp. TaxID=2004662 RepID=UPI003BA9B286
MILSRLSNALRRQDWLTILIESVLIIAGVLIALQVNNWNEARANAQGAVSALTRLQEEVEANIAIIDDSLAELEGEAEAREGTVAVIGSCDPSAEAAEQVAQAIMNTTGDIVPAFQEPAAEGLARREEYLDLMSNGFRSAFYAYTAAFSDEQEQLQVNFGLMWDHHVIYHPAILLQPNPDRPGVSSLVIVGGLPAVCEDTQFVNRFVLTIAWHNSTASRLRRFRETAVDFLAVVEQEKEALP